MIVLVDDLQHEEEQTLLRNYKLKLKEVILSLRNVIALAASSKKKITYLDSQEFNLKIIRTFCKLATISSYCMWVSQVLETFPVLMVLTISSDLIKHILVLNSQKTFGDLYQKYMMAFDDSSFDCLSLLTDLQKLCPALQKNYNFKCQIGSWSIEGAPRKIYFHPPYPGNDDLFFGRTAVMILVLFFELWRKVVINLHKVAIDPDTQNSMFGNYSYLIAIIIIKSDLTDIRNIWECKASKFERKRVDFFKVCLINFEGQWNTFDEELQLERQSELIKYKQQYKKVILSIRGFFELSLSKKWTIESLDKNEQQLKTIQVFCLLTSIVSTLMWFYSQVFIGFFLALSAFIIRFSYIINRYKHFQTQYQIELKDLNQKYKDCYYQLGEIEEFSQRLQHVYSYQIPTPQQFIQDLSDNYFLQKYVETSGKRLDKRNPTSRSMYIDIQTRQTISGMVFAFHVCIYAVALLTNTSYTYVYPENYGYYLVAAFCIAFQIDNVLIVWRSYPACLNKLIVNLGCLIKKLEGDEKVFVQI